MITGWPCGERAMLSAPSTLKNLPSWWTACMARRIEEQAARAVEDEGVVVPGVPQRVHHVDELAGLLVAQRVRRQGGMAEIARGVVVGRGDDVPRRPPGRDVVERGELAGHVVGLGEAGRDRAAQADARRGAGQRGEQRHRLEHVHEHREAAPGVQVLGPRRRRVGDEEQVEASALGKLRQVRGSSRCRSIRRRSCPDAATRPDGHRRPGRSTGRGRSSIDCSSVQLLSPRHVAKVYRRSGLARQRVRQDLSYS